MKIDEKLENFSKVAAQEAYERREQILADMKRETDRVCGETEKTARARAEARLRKERYNAEQMKGKKILDASVAAKKELIALRNQLVETLFANIEGKLRAYVASPAYGPDLAAGIKAALAGVTGECVVLLAQADMAFAEAITQEAGVPVRETPENLLGGFKIFWPQRNALEDYSLRSRMEEERKDFSLFKIDSYGIARG
jgi:vacuolar-type H+-ATPase subunit E/Vma4